VIDPTLARCTYTDFRGIEGHVLERLEWDDSGVTLTLDGVKHYWGAEGDCCASAWVEDVNPYATELPAKVTAVEGRWSIDGEHGDAVEDTGFFSIRTERGHIDVELRVNHNGYYGGQLDYRGPA
jgi:hypothetical protein